MRRTLLPLALVLAGATPALANDKQAAAALIGCVTVVPLALFPLGLAFQLLLRAVAPVRTRELVHAVDKQGWRSLALGFTNSILLWLVVLATLKDLPVVALALVLTFLGFAGAGLHGIARAIGARALGGEGANGPGAEVKELALGWFVLVYVACFPIVGWVIGTVWLVRGVGAVLITILQALESKT